MSRINNDLELWEKRVKEFRSSGLSLGKWCEKNGVKKSTMNYYCYDRPRNLANKRKIEQNLSLVPVVLEDSSTISNASCIEIMIGDVSIKVDKDTNLQFLRKVVGALSNDRS